MKRVMKIILWAGGVLLLVIIGAIVYITSFLPKADLRDINVEVTSDRVNRGEYLALHVMMCVDCHSERDWQYFSGPVKSGTEGQGGEVFGKEMGLPGKFISPNITPYALKNWSDAEIFRAITQGIDRQGNPLFPIMPYPEYGTLDEEDIYAVIAYLRSIPEIASTPEQSVASFPMNIMMHLIPKEPEFTKRPAPSDSVALGKYLTTAGGCIHCHTVSDHGKLDMSRAFAGGMEIPLPQGKIVSANITPSETTGIGNWGADAFVARFKAYESDSLALPLASNIGYNTIMPWSMYAGMTTTDLRMIFHYLKSLKPIENKVPKPGASIQ